MGKPKQTNCSSSVLTCIEIILFFSFLKFDQIKEGDNWLLEYVEVTCTYPKKTWTFICNEWLTKFPIINNTHVASLKANAGAVERPAVSAGKLPITIYLSLNATKIK